MVREERREHELDLVGREGDRGLLERVRIPIHGDQLEGGIGLEKSAGVSSSAYGAVQDRTGRGQEEAEDLFDQLDAEGQFHEGVDAKDDKVVDKQYGSALRSLVTFMMEDPRVIGPVLNEMWALRALERVGDHARNIAEYVIYLVKGNDVRHLPYDQIISMYGKQD